MEEVSNTNEYIQEHYLELLTYINNNFQDIIEESKNDEKMKDNIYFSYEDKHFFYNIKNDKIHGISCSDYNLNTPRPIGCCN